MKPKTAVGEEGPQRKGEPHGSSTWDLSQGLGWAPGPPLPPPPAPASLSGTRDQSHRGQQPLGGMALPACHPLFLLLKSPLRNSFPVR